MYTFSRVNTKSDGVMYISWHVTVPYIAELYWLAIRIFASIENLNVYDGTLYHCHARSLCWFLMYIFHYYDEMFDSFTLVVLWRCFNQAVIFLYLLDEDTSLLVLIPAGIGSVIELHRGMKIAYSSSITMHVLLENYKKNLV